MDARPGMSETTGRHEMAAPPRRRRRPSFSLSSLSTAWVMPAIFFILSADICLAPALYNRFPLIHATSGIYLKHALRPDSPHDRSSFYSYFLHLVMSINDFPKACFWHVVFFQFLIAAALVRICVAQFSTPQNTDLKSFFIVLLLVVGTNFPWLICYITPDIFAGLLCLSLYLVLFCWAQLGKSSKVLVTGVLLLSLLMHFSHLAMGILVLSISGLLFLFEPTRNLIPVRNWRAGLGVLAASLLLTWITHSFLGGGSPLQVGRIQFLSKLNRTGILGKLLKEHCRDREYALCNYQQALKDQRVDFLWNKSSALYKIGGWSAPRSIVSPMIDDSLIYYPFKSFVAWFDGIGFELTHFGVAAEYQNPHNSAKTIIFKGYSRSARDFFSSRQEYRKLRPLLDKLGDSQRLVALIALLLALFTIAMPSSPRKFKSKVFVSFVVLFFFTYLFLCVGFAGISTRYPSQVAWLIFLAVLLRMVESRPRDDY